jgi:hypothetical protein
MPHDDITSGKNTASLVTKRGQEVDETTRAEQVEEAIEPNKSAAIPAISPTLSPTLSAIVPGFKGESSANASPTFPARSAPTSAALV